MTKHFITRLASRASCAVLATAMATAGAVETSSTASTDEHQASTATAATGVGSAVEPSAVEFEAADGTRIYGRYYEASSPRAIILLFHQAESSKNEYATIAPRLVAEGYSALAIDQRSGGEMFGPNETVRALGHSAPYLEAKQDLEAALAFARNRSLPIVLWGSSYSASLAIIVASEHPHDVRAIATFSPGEYFPENLSSVRAAAKKIAVPFYVTSAISADEVQAAKEILTASPAKIRIQYLPKSGGVHGSSTLIASRNTSGAADNWRAVLDFLGHIDFTSDAQAAAVPPGYSMTREGSVHDFDYFAGAWTTQQHKLKTRGVGSTDWEEFPATLCMTPYLDGAATVDELYMPTKHIAGLTLRTFDPQRKQWAIYWVNSALGRLDPVPEIGGFSGDRGEFYAQDHDENGRPIKSRYIWTIIDHDHARWEQAFSYDDSSWETNWKADFTRADREQVCDHGRPKRQLP